MKPKRRSILPLSTLLATAALSSAAAAQQTDGSTLHYGGSAPVVIDRPLPGLAEIPPLADMTGQPSAEELAIRAEIRKYRQQIREIRKRYLGTVRIADLRARGLAEIREFTDPAAFIPLIEELSNEQDDVRLALLDHFGSQGDWGQAALGWIAIRGEDEAMHWEAIKRLQPPVGQPLLNVIDYGLRSGDDEVANLSGRLSGHLDLFNTIPLLIHGQGRTQIVRPTGDDAWILVGKQRVYIRALIPIIGENSGAFMPVPGVITEGVILRVRDAVAVIYRTEIHRTLVAMTTRDWGQSTAHLGYDIDAWKKWYDEEYLPVKRERDLVERMVDEDPRKAARDDRDDDQ